MRNGTCVLARDSFVRERDLNFAVDAGTGYKILRGTRLCRSGSSH